jgi:hypothetical protein
MAFQENEAVSPILDGKFWLPDHLGITLGQFWTEVNCLLVNFT